MATKKRRMGRGMRGLGGTPAEHRISADSYLELASHDFNEAAKLLEGRAAKGAGECRYALAWWANAQLSLGSAEAHTNEAHRMTPAAHMVPVRKLGEDTRQLLEAKCLIGKGLSGLGRKPTRRKSRR